MVVAVGLRGDRAAVGRTYKIAGRPHKVIGVLPRGFWFFSDTPQVWTLIGQSTFVDPKTALVFACASAARRHRERQFG